MTAGVARKLRLKIPLATGRYASPAPADEGYGYFNPYLTWYNHEHYHSGIDYVPPDQAHRGLRDLIVAQRQEQKLAQYRRRREVNLKEVEVLFSKSG